MFRKLAILPDSAGGPLACGFPFYSTSNVDADRLEAYLPSQVLSRASATRLRNGDQLSMVASN